MLKYYIQIFWEQILGVKNRFFAYHPHASTSRMIVSEGFWNVRTPDVLLKRFMFLIGGYIETLFAKNTGKPVCACGSNRIRKRTKCHTYLQHVWHFWNPTPEWNFWLPQKDISGGRLRKSCNQVLLYAFSWRFDSLSGV